MRLLSTSLLFFFIFSPASQAFEAKGRLNMWSLYVTDSFDTTSVIDIYESASCDDRADRPVERVYGKEKQSIEERCNSVCCIERVIRGDEIIVERVYEADGEIERDRVGKIGDTWLANLGGELRAHRGNWDFLAKGNFTTSLLQQRAFYGNRKYRARFTDFYVQYEEKQKDFNYRYRLGRQSVVAGAAVDGASFDLYWGSAGFRESRSIGVFGGLMPHPITKHVDLDFRTAGLTLHYIPDFANTTSTKLLVDAAIVGEMYKSDLHRFYFFSRSHFSPFPELSLFHYSTIDLPAKGDDSGISSNHFSLNAHYRPTRQWFIGAGFTQFKIDRLLKESVLGSQEELDNNPSAIDRVGDRLDRSHRYRFDLRLSYKPIPLAQPYLRVRYERRTFDSSKTRLNRDPSEPDVIAEQNLRLLDKKNAYQGTFGLRLFPIHQLESETAFTYLQRYQSRAYDVWQSLSWDSGSFWTANIYGQMLWSDKRIRNSNPSLGSRSVDSLDFYAGIGASAKFLTDFLAHFSYDFAHEDDYELSKNILTHSFWARVDYRF